MTAQDRPYKYGSRRFATQEERDAYGERFQLMQSARRAGFSTDEASLRRFVAWREEMEEDRRRERELSERRRKIREEMGLPKGGRLPAWAVRQYEEKHAEVAE